MEFAEIISRYISVYSDKVDINPSYILNYFRLKPGRLEEITKKLRKYSIKKNFDDFYFCDKPDKFSIDFPSDQEVLFYNIDDFICTHIRHRWFINTMTMVGMNLIELKNANSYEKNTTLIDNILYLEKTIISKGFCPEFLKSVEHYVKKKMFKDYCNMLERYKIA